MLRTRTVVVGASALGVLLLAAGGVYFLASSHHAPPVFALGSPAAEPSGSLPGKWKLASGSEVGYRVREKFINQTSTTEAVARTSMVTGGMQVHVSGSDYVASSIDFVAGLSGLTSQDKYATFQAFQRDFFVRSVYLQTDVWPTAEFKADSIAVPIKQSPGPATMDLPGKFKVHGVTKDVTTHLSVQLNGADIELVGSISLDMRDYNIDVPDISFTKAEPNVLMEYHLILSRS